MHNNIKAAGSKDRPPMLRPGRYSQWRSRFLSTKPLTQNRMVEYLRKCIFEGPYTPTNVLIAAVEAAENILPVAAHEEAEIIHNMITKNKLYFQAEKAKAIFLDFDCTEVQIVRHFLAGSCSPNSDKQLSGIAQNLKDRMHHHTCNLLPHDQVRLLDTMAKRSPNQLLLNQSPFLEEDSDPEQARRDKDNSRNNLHSLLRVFQEVVQTLTNNNLRTSSNSRNKT
ncbi:hypothetical protein Tco_0269912 [Tanacetum coccineum]